MNAHCNTGDILRLSCGIDPGVRVGIITADRESRRYCFSGDHGHKCQVPVLQILTGRISFNEVTKTKVSFSIVMSTNNLKSYHML